ncbi:uncharacterized protein LOC132683370 [Panthera onca]
MWRLAASVRRRAPWEREGPGEAGTRAGRALLTPSRPSSLAPFVAGAGNRWDEKEMEKLFREQKGCKLGKLKRQSKESKEQVTKAKENYSKLSRQSTALNLTELQQILCFLHRTDCISHEMSKNRLTGMQLQK